MRSLYKKFLSVLFAFLFLILPSQVLAQEKIDQFNVTLIAHQDGSMSVEEKIVYDFGEEYRHGIFRNIPLVSKVGDLYRVILVDFLEINRDGQDEEYEVNSAAKETEVKIGSPDKTISGAHTYLIKYKVENGIGSNFLDHDEIYWNVTGDGWEIPIEKTSIEIKTDFGVSVGETICFTGIRGSKQSNCSVNNMGEGKDIVILSPLASYEGLTVVSSFPVNTFPKSVLQKEEPFIDPDFSNFLKIYTPIALGLNFLLVPYLLYWYNKNKSKLRFGKPSVNFDIPKDNDSVITPAESGTVDNITLDKDDILATIFDLAIRKYLKIEEVKKVKTLMPDELDYKLIKLKDFGDLNEFERKLVEHIFKDGDSVKLKDFKLNFLDFHNLEVKNFSLLIKKGLYKENPKGTRGMLLTFGILAIISLNLLLGLVLIYLSRKFTGRTQLGDKIDWQIDGLKIFLKSMSRHHGWQAKNLITVEKYIPYAIALGLHDEFMDQLKIINPNYNPSWYSGGGSFYHGYSGMYSSMSSSVTTSASSSSSGFSGGSSGGGGGGGGGGSW